MKRQLLSFIFCIIASAAIYGSSGSSAERRKELLNYVKKVPYSTNLTILTKNLSKVTKNDMEKAEVIFFWLHHNIPYDVKNYQRGKHLSQDPSTTLRNKKAVCGGYSNLYKAMADKMNLKTRVVSGYSKGAGYYIGKRFTKSDHAWNIITIDGKDLLIDATWGAGHVRKKWGKFKYVKRLNYYWFNTKPNEFVFSHLPEKNNSDQLMSETLSLKEYEVLPRVRSSFFKSRVANSDKILKEFKQGVKHNFPKVYDLSFEVAIIKAPLEMKKNTKYLFQLYTLEGQKLAIIHNKKFLTSIEKPENNSFRFVFSPEKRGKIKIGILNTPSKGAKKTYKTLMEYEVK